MEKLNLNIPEAEVFYDKNRRYVKILWTEAANKVMPDEGALITLRIFENILKYKPKYILSDSKKLQFPYTNEYRSFVINQVIPLINSAGTVEKLAHIISEDIITSIGLQLLEEDFRRTNPPWRSGYFRTEEEAEQWLFSK